MSTGTDYMEWKRRALEAETDRDTWRRACAQARAEQAAERFAEIRRRSEQEAVLLTRAEQAERGRDNAVAAAGAAREETRGVRDALARVSEQAEKWGEALKATSIARERAEADNAAMHMYIGGWVAQLRAFPAQPGDTVDIVRAEMSVTLESSIPVGAEMLAEAEALRRVADEARTLLSWHDNGLVVAPPEVRWPELRAAVDALPKRVP
jgi:hypothetical protein